MYEKGVTQQDYADAFGVELPEEGGELEAGGAERRGAPPSGIRTTGAGAGG